MWNAFYRKVGGPSRAICWMPSFKLTVCNRTAKARCCKQTLGAALFEERKWRCVGPVGRSLYGDLVLSQGYIKTAPARILSPAPEER